MKIPIAQLRQAISDAFTSHGVESACANILAAELTEATVAGYESHGIGRVKTYLNAMRDGRINPKAALKTVRDTPSIALYDAGMGFGIPVALEAAGIAAQKAKKMGISAVTVRNCGDVARLAPYAKRIADEGMIGIVMANDSGGSLAVAPHGGTQPALSTNPIAAGIPRSSGDPLVFDFATSQIALGAARAAARRKEPVAEDTIVGIDGMPLTDPEAVFSRLASLLPLGGTAFGFKGTALATLVEALAGGLSGDGCSGEFPERSDRNSLYLQAIDPEAFVDKREFESRMTAFTAWIRSNKPRPGFPPVRVPGDRHRPVAEYVEIRESSWHELLNQSREP